jgi:hypothetical protein
MRALYYLANVFTLGFVLTGTIVQPLTAQDIPPLISAVSHVASGGGWKTTLTLVNLAPTLNDVSVWLFDDNGNPMPLPMTVTQFGVPAAITDSHFSAPIAPLGILVVETEAPSATTVAGWARINYQSSVAGYAVFRQRDASGRDMEGTAPVQGNGAARVLVAFDNTAGFRSAFALANMNASTVTVTATVRNESGFQVDRESFALPGLGHAAFVSTDWFGATAGIRGTIEFSTGTGTSLVGLGLRFNPTGSFTSIPATLRAAAQ